MMNSADDLRILLVDHDAASATVLSAALEARGCRVELFPDFRGALAMIEGGETISAMVTSVQLPAGTPHGVALANMAVQKRPNLPVVFIADDPDLTQWVDDRWGPVLLKPVDCDRVLAAIELAMSSKP